MSFPKDFLWGVATASHQIEGAYNEDGKSLNIWDALIDDNILFGGDAKVACDHYHRYKEDVAIMKEIGVKSYRFFFFGKIEIFRFGNFVTVKVTVTAYDFAEDGERTNASVATHIYRYGIVVIVVVLCRAIQDCCVPLVVIRHGNDGNSVVHEIFGCGVEKNFRRRTVNQHIAR